MSNPSLASPVRQNINGGDNGSVGYNEQLLSGQAQYFPERRQQARSFFHFEKTELLHYIASVHWLSLKWFTIMRSIIFILYLISTPFLILSHIKLPIDQPQYTLTTPWFFLTPYWIFHCGWLLFYTIVLISTFNNRTVIKQLHEYTQRLDPIPTPPSLKFAHYLYTILITLSPLFFITELLWAPSQAVAHANGPVIYLIFIAITTNIELFTNAIPLLWPHILFTYFTSIIYYIAVIITYRKSVDIKIQSHWFNIWANSNFQNIFIIPTFSLLFVGLSMAIIIFALWRQLRWCKKERKREEHQGAIYFFNTSEYGTSLKLNTSSAFHAGVETTISPNA